MWLKSRTGHVVRRRRQRAADNSAIWASFSLNKISSEFEDCRAGLHILLLYLHRLRPGGHCAVQAWSNLWELIWLRTSHYSMTEGVHNWLPSEVVSVAAVLVSGLAEEVVELDKLLLEMVDTFYIYIKALTINMNSRSCFTLIVSLLQDPLLM